MQNQYKQSKNVRRNQPKNLQIDVHNLFEFKKYKDMESIDYKATLPLYDGDKTVFLQMLDMYAQGQLNKLMISLTEAIEVRDF
jgi:hypothetical protein